VAGGIGRIIPHSVEPLPGPQIAHGPCTVAH